MTADGAFVAVGALEPKFYAGLLARLGLDPAAWPQWDRDRWPALTEVLTSIFLSRTAGTGSGSSPTPTSASRASFAGRRVRRSAPGRARQPTWSTAGLRQSAVVPRFGRTPGGLGRPAPWPGEHDAELRAELGA